MAASSIPDLLNFEYHIELAAVTFLNTATGLDVYRTVIETDIITPRLEIDCLVTEFLDPPILHGGGANPNTVDYSAMKALFTIRIVTDNAVGGSDQTDDHALYRSQVRQAMMISSTNWDTTSLPYYNLLYCRPANALKETDGDWNITAIDYDINFEIRDDAWPA